MQRKTVTRKPAKKLAPKPNPVLAFVRHRAKVILGLLLAAILVHDVFGDRGLLAMRRTQMEIEALQQEITQLNADNERLAGEVQALKTDPTMIERIAREELNLARPGEKIFKLPPKQQ